MTKFSFLGWIVPLTNATKGQNTTQWNTSMHLSGFGDGLVQGSSSVLDVHFKLAVQLSVASYSLWLTLPQWDSTPPAEVQFYSSCQCVACALLSAPSFAEDGKLNIIRIKTVDFSTVNIKKLLKVKHNPTTYHAGLKCTFATDVHNTLSS